MDKMTIQELAERDLKKAERSLAYASSKPNTPADELEHIKELYELRKEILEIVKGQKNV